MHTFLKTLLAASALGLAVGLPAAHAQMTFSGSTYGTFVDPDHAFTTVTNGAPVSLFASGDAYRPVDTQTSIAFTGSSFSDVGIGDQLDLGNIDITNGRTLLGSTAKWATMDLYLNLPEQGVVDFKLATLLFAIDSTANNGTGVPDLFLVDLNGANSLTVDGKELNFDLQLTNPAFAIGNGASIGETASDSFGIYANISFTPVPEPSTYALAGAALLIGFIIRRRFIPSRSAAA